MKRIYLLLCVFLLGSFAVAQQERMLVGINGDVVRLKKGESASHALQQFQKEKGLRQISEATCTNPLQFGYDPADYPPSGTVWVSSFKDMFGEWFTVPSDGVIDTFYMYNPGTYMNQDSTLALRLMESRLNDSTGPGYGALAPYAPGPADPTLGYGPRCWGYFTNTNDLEGQEYNISPQIGGVAAFVTDATPPDTTAWVSTLQKQFPNAPLTVSPAGDEIWGLGGYPFRHLQVNAVNKFNLHIIGAPAVHAGQAVLLALIVPGAHPVGTDNTVTGVYDWPSQADANGFYHTHAWKFYEHNSTCGIPGWVDRGYWEVNIWYSMTVSGNTPPRVTSITNLGTTLGGSPRDVLVNLEDCDFANEAAAGVASAHMAYSVDGGPFQVLPLDFFGGTTYHGQIPAIAPTTGRPYSRTVQFYVAAADSQGLVMDSGVVHSYKIISFGDEWYYPDTAVACVPQSIKDTPGYQQLDTTSTLGVHVHPTWFEPPYSGSGSAPKDDGTAGPFALGGPFIYFGDTVNYAWIGMNGAMSLSKFANDTIDVSDNGFYTDYDYYYQEAEHLGRGDTAGAGNIPRNFIATLWYDLIYVDTSNVQYGRICWKSDSCRFISEFDSIGINYDVGTGETGAFLQSPTTFRTILNKCDGTIQMQWDNVQESGAPVDSISSVGLTGNYGRIIRPDSVATQVGSNPGFLKFFRGSENGPYQLKPRDGWCVEFHPTAGSVAASGWNILSLPVTPQGNNNAKTTLYPSAVSQAFTYRGGYVQSGTLAPGMGYWLKFPAANTYATAGLPVYNGVDSVKTDWNLVGSIVKPVLTSAIVQSPTNIVTSNYYGYNHGYVIATEIDPGKGYWVKSNQTGALQLTASSIPKATPGITDLTVLNKITVSDAAKYQQPLYVGSESQLKTPASFYELPPTVPDGVFDVRFASQRMLETYPDNMAAGKVYEYPISLQSSSYPVTVQWDIKNTNGRTLTLTDGLGGRIVNNVVLNNTGSIQITNASVKSLVLRLVDGVAVPKEFALSQNYPNPFNPTTRFNVDVPKTTNVDVIVYNILGQKVATLMTGLQSAGYHTVEWDGRDAHGLVVPSGMYFVRMSADQFSSVRKAMMLK